MMSQSGGYLCEYVAALDPLILLRHWGCGGVGCRHTASVKAAVPSMVHPTKERELIRLVCGRMSGSFEGILADSAMARNPAFIAAFARASSS